MKMESWMAVGMRRRRFMALLGSAVAATPMPLRAQQADRVRTIAVLMGLDNDLEAQARIKAFEEGLAKEWSPNKDVRIVYRFAAGDAGRMRALASELVALRPDVIVGHSTPVVTELVRATRSIPIVFVVVADPVGSGFAASIPRPGGNATGFTNLDVTISGKLLNMLKQLTPSLSRAALMYNPDTVARAGLFGLYLRPFREAASSLAVEAITAAVHTSAEIDSQIAQLGHKPGAGLIVLPDNFTTVHRQVIIECAAHRRVPTIYPYRYFVEAGGLMSYGVDVTDLFRRASEYVSRILRGANPAELPVQAPTKFELAINLKTAKSLDLAVPRILLAGADALIE
jgi:putative ABC transport system substrate-binding protein